MCLCFLLCWLLRLLRLLLWWLLRLLHHTLLLSLWFILLGRWILLRVLLLAQNVSHALWLLGWRGLGSWSGLWFLGWRGLGSWSGLCGLLGLCRLLDLLPGKKVIEKKHFWVRISRPRGSTGSAFFVPPGSYLKQRPKHLQRACHGGSYSQPRLSWPEQDPTLQIWPF
jgi:hypothetical protein